MSKEKLNKKKIVLKEEAPKKEKDLILLILIIILIIITIILIIVKIASGKSIDPNDSKVKELHNYFNTENLTDCNGLFNYSDKKVSYTDVSAENKLCIAYHKSELSNLETETYKPQKKQTTCTIDNMTFRIDDDTKVCNVTKISREVVDNTYKKIFGKDVEDNDSFKIDSFNICYLKDDNYYCGLSETYTYSIGGESKIYRVINRAVEKNKDKIIIYDYFIKINGNNCYANYTPEIENTRCTKALTNEKNIEFKFMKKYGTKYKHIFQKNNDGTYYWVSSEPVK